MRKKIFVSLLLVCVLVCFGSFGSIGVMAGVSKTTVLTDASIANGIGSNIWINHGGVKGEGGNVVFDEDVGENARIVCITHIQDVVSQGISRNLQGSYTLAVNAVPQGARLSLFYGLSLVNDAMGKDGSVEVTFTDEGGSLAVGVCRYEGGECLQIAPPQVYPGISYGQALQIAVLFEGGSVLVTVGGRTIADTASPNNEVSAAGYFGIGQVGGQCGAVLSSINVDAWSYRNAETPSAENAAENFDNGSYNQNIWYSYSERDMAYDAECGIFVENGKLAFRRIDTGYFGTMYSYSNFELNFDVVHVQRADGTDASGDTLHRETDGWFGVSAGNGWYNGRVADTGAPVMFTYRCDGMLFRYSGGAVRETKPISSVAGGVNLFSQEYDGQVFGFKVRVEDGVFTFSMCRKPSDGSAGEYVELLRADSDTTPYGYIRILAGSVSNILLDNITVENLDRNGSDLSVGYAGNSLEGTGDWQYTDSWSEEDLLDGAR